MKRILSLILALSMLMSVTLTSCGKKDESGKKDEAKTEAAAKEEAHGNCKDGKSHSFVTSTAEADCTARGYTMNTCKTCGYVYLGDTSPALGHDWGDEVSVIPLGCTTDGKSEKTCRRCGMSSEHTVPHAGHVYELSAEEDVNGTVYVCTVCGDIITLNDGEELPLEKEESMYLPDRPADFSFTVLC